MITASLFVAYGAVAGLIGLTIGEYKPKRASASYLQKIERAYAHRVSYNSIVL